MKHKSTHSIAGSDNGDTIRIVMDENLPENNHFF